MKPFLTGMLTGGYEGLEGTANAVPDDKMTWKPLDNGRTVLDLVGDAAQTADTVSQVVESRGEFKVGPELFAKLRAERANWTREETMSHLASGHARLVAAIDACSDEELATPVTMPMRGGFTLPLAGWAMMANRTYVSRFAQINYIQTLYGDNEPH